MAWLFILITEPEGLDHILSCLGSFLISLVIFYPFQRKHEELQELVDRYLLCIIQVLA